MAFIPYGPWWRAHRKLFNDFINPSRTSDYDANQVKVVSDFLVNLHRKPEAFKEHISLCAPPVSVVFTRSAYGTTLSLTGSLALSVAYGIQVETPENEFFCRYTNSLKVSNEALVPGTFIVDILPFRELNHLSI